MVLALLSIHLSAFTCALYAADPSGVGFQNIDPVVGECLSGGHKAASSGNFDEAIKMFSACAEKHPNSAAAHFFLGMAFLHKKETEKATGELKKASQLDPNNMEAAVMLGRLYTMDEQKRGLARELLERALTAEPHRDDVRFDLARVYALTGEEKKSLQEFQRIFADEPRYGLYHTEFAKILIAAGEKKAARSHLQRAIVIAPDFEPAKKLLESLDREEKGAAPQEEKKWN